MLQTRTTKRNIFFFLHKEQVKKNVLSTKTIQRLAGKTFDTQKTACAKEGKRRKDIKKRGQSTENNKRNPNKQNKPLPSPSQTRFWTFFGPPFENRAVPSLHLSLEVTCRSTNCSASGFSANESSILSALIFLPHVQGLSCEHCKEERPQITSQVSNQHVMRHLDLSFHESCKKQKTTRQQLFKD